MNQYAEIKVTLDAGQTDIWRAKDRTWDGYVLDGGAFVIKKNGAVVGIYSMAHVVSVKIE